MVRDSTFFANRADRGGSGISSADPGGGYLDLKIEGSTFSGNTGGGANGSGAISNTAWIDLGPDENGELHFPNWVNVRSSIVAGNAAGDIRGNYTDGGFNIVEGTAAEVGLETDGDGKAVLMDNGGPTETIALVPGSEAIDAGDSFGSTTDQCGEVRPSDYGGVPDAEGGDGSDVGAFERRAPASVPDFYATYEEQTLDVDAPGVVANNSSGEGGSPTAALVSGPAHGDLDLSPDGSFSYAPDPGYSGTDSFSYAAGDGASASAPAGVEITVRNVVPPDTQITAGPNGSTNKPTVRFTSSSEPNATFECSLGNAAFEDCSSPKSYPGLPDGPHKFEVRAVDAAGKVDASPAGRSWTVDTAKPGAKLVINNGRANTPDRKVTLKTDARDPAPGDVVSMRFKNGGSRAWSAWRPYAASGPWNLTIGAGKKVVMAQFKDAAGNVSVVASDSIRYRP